MTSMVLTMVYTIAKIMVMKVATTIQISQEENILIARLKKEIEAPSKKAVILHALALLNEQVKNHKRVHRLKSLSKKLSQQSLEINNEWSSQSTALKN